MVGLGRHYLLIDAVGFVYIRTLLWAPVLVNVGGGALVFLVASAIAPLRDVPSDFFR